MGEVNVPNISNRSRVRSWLQKLGTEDHLAFSGQDELKMLLELYDDNPLHPIQYHFDNRFKGRLPLPDLSLCSTASENVDRNRTSENYPTDEGLLRTDDGRFINASTIEGKERTYIATQHPLPSTVLDFWKMVLAEKPAVVIMLNKDDYDKSYQDPDEPELVQYWPGTSKSGLFIDSILLEDKDSGGTVKISVLPEPPEHDIQELESKAESNSAKESNPPLDAMTTDKIVTPNLKSSTFPASTSPASTCPISTPPASTSPSPTSPTLPETAPTKSTTLMSTTDKEFDENNMPHTATVTPTPNNTAKSESDEKHNSEPSKKPKVVNVDNDSGGNGHQEYKLSPHIEYSRLLVEYDGEQHQLWHIRCGGWKDQEAPDLDLFMDLWQLVQEKIKTHKVNSGEKHKIVIHCTGGVGRTGTFIAVDIAGQELKEKQKSGKWDEFSMEKVIHFLRKKRMNMVGSVSQYIFCHRAALNMFGALPHAKEQPNVSDFTKR